MYERLENCPNCDHTKFNNKLIIQDFSISRESFATCQCDKCGLIFTNPRPDQESIGQYYQSPEYVSHNDSGKRVIDFIYRFARNFTLKRKYRIITGDSKAKSLLDFGCGTGHFMKYCKTKGMSVQGIETHSEAQKQAIQNTSALIYSSLDQIPKKDKFDIVTAWHVIEHVHDLKTTLKKLRKILTPNGRMFIALPNYQSVDGQYYQEYWAGYDVPRHLYHFSQHVFLDVASRNKLKVIQILPMKLDAYYVSLLSESYKGNKNAYLRAFINGWKSNRSAKSTGEYSSLIYILENKK